MDREQLIKEAVLDFRARRARAMALKKNKNKIKMAKKRAMKRLASSDKLIKRARKAAIQMLRKRVAGKMGMEYNNLSISQKIVIDKKLQRMLPAVGKLAKRLFPKIRKKEMERFNSMKQQMSNAIKEDLISEAKFEDIDGTTSINTKYSTKVYFNPTFLEIIRIIAKSRSFAGKKELRFLIDVEDKNKLYVWDSYDAEHANIISYFGILDSDKKKEIYSGYLRLQDKEYRSNIYKGKTNNYENDSDHFDRLTESDFEQLKKKSTLFKNIFDVFQMFENFHRLAEAKIDMGGYNVYIDPSFNEIEGLLNKSAYNQLRFIVDLTDKNRFYVWDAYSGDIHIDVFKEIQLGDSGDFYNDRMYIRGYIDKQENAISLYDQDKTRPVFNKIPKFKKLVDKYNRIIDEAYEGNKRNWKDIKSILRSGKNFSSKKERSFEIDNNGKKYKISLDNDKKIKIDKLNESKLELGNYVVYLNPSFNELQGLINKTGTKEVRFLIDKSDKDAFYVWDAYLGTHHKMVSVLKLGEYNNPDILKGYIDGEQQDMFIYNRTEHMSYLKNNAKFKKILEKYPPRFGFSDKDLMDEEKENPCWDGYEMIGMKKKGKREVPNCVPVEEDKKRKIPNSNPIAKALSNKIFQKRVERDRTKYDRKKDKKVVNEGENND